jgi:hypothetical protein
MENEETTTFTFGPTVVAIDKDTATTSISLTDFTHDSPVSTSG